MASNIINKKLKESVDDDKKEDVSGAEFLKLQELVKDHERRMEQMERKYLETEGKVTLTLDRIEKVDSLSKDQEKRDSKQDSKINMLDDRLTHFEITVKTIEA